MPARTKRQPLRAAFLDRATKAVESWSRTLTPKELATAVAEPRDALVVLRAIQQPGAWTAVLDVDPLAPARARGVQAERRLLEAEGGLLGVEEVAKALGITRQAVDKRRRAGRLIAVSRGESRYGYPAWQLAGAGTLRGLERVLLALRDVSPLSQIAFLLAPSGFLGGRTPLAALRKGDAAKVLEAAEGFLEEGAD